ncbi:MAG: hypothetical protein WB762_15215 [Candidatus Sulfotelmatobacter sp.]
MAGRKKQRLVNLSEGIRLVITDHGLDYGNRFTADVYAADGKCYGSLGTGSNSDEDPEARVEHFAAEYDLCILKALSAPGSEPAGTQPACCNQAWVLKKSSFLSNSQDLGDSKCLEN